ncbi:MAG: hypothetical protein LBF15_04220 [Candidatus Peribacteria bacterium]|nr:hypothetical protein [Candidatus Peribacteria bacterium]
MERHDLIAWTYGKVLQKDTNREEIRSLIEKIKASFSSTNSYWYWDVTADKAIFASLLLDF